MFYLWLLLVGALAAWYVGAPLWHKAVPGTARLSVTPQGMSRQTLRERRDTLLRHLKELEFDRSMEKIEAEDYTRLRAAVSAEAATVLRQLEEAEAAARDVQSARGIPDAGGRGTGDNLLSLNIETEILIARARHKNHRRTSRDGNGVGANGDGGNGVGGNEAVAAGWRCAACGRAMSDSDRFCATCGTRRPDTNGAGG